MNAIGAPSLWFAAAALGGAYGASLLLLAVAWIMPALRTTSGLRLRDAAVVYLYANLYKYIPGNVFHFLARQALSAALGWRQPVVAACSAFEAFTQVAVSAAMVVALGGGYLHDVGRGVSGYVAWIFAVGALAGLVTLSRGFSFRMFGWAVSTPRIELLTMLGIASLHLIFLSILGLIAWLTAEAVSGSWMGERASLIAASYVAAWMIGFIAPGASGGLGVREAAFVSLTGPLLGSGESAIVAVIMRIVTVFGDVTAGVLAMLLGSSTLRNGVHGGGG